MPPYLGRCHIRTRARNHAADFVNARRITLTVSSGSATRRLLSRKPAGVGGVAGGAISPDKISQRKSKARSDKTYAAPHRARYGRRLRAIQSHAQPILFLPRASRSAPWRRVSPSSSMPPGIDHSPSSGAFARLINATRPSAMMIAPTPTSGCCGYSRSMASPGIRAQILS